MSRDQPPLEIVRSWAEQRFPDRAWPWTSAPAAAPVRGPLRLTVTTRVAAGASGALLALGIAIGLATGPETSLASREEIVVVAAAPAPAVALPPAPAVPVPVAPAATPEPVRVPEAVNATPAAPVAETPAPAGDVAPATDDTSTEDDEEEPASDEEETDEEPVADEPTRPALPAVGRVTVVWMADGRSERTFAADSPLPYVATTLASQGLVLPRYHGTGHGTIANAVAFLGGLEATPEQQAGCATPTAVEDTTGCVLPEATPSLLGQLSGAGKTWKVYAGDLGATGMDSCRAPVLDQPDPATTAPRPGDAFSSARVPALWFASVTAGADCGSVVDLAQLDKDLATDEGQPDFSLIVPNLCDAGGEVVCPDGRPSGPAAADAFLAGLIPKLTGTDAHRKDGLVVVVWDQAPVAGPFADARPCCTSRPAGVPGGGRTGAVVLSPFVTAGTVQQKPYDHIALLRSIEDLFGLDRLGLASQPGVQGFGPKVFAAAPAAGD